MVVPNEGKIILLDRAFCTPANAPEDYSLRLFQNNVTVNDASTLADFVIATFTGYGNVSITRASMPTPTITANVAYTERATDPTFTHTGGASQTVYGWILVGVTSGKVLLGQNFDVAHLMSLGAVVTIDPFKVGLKTLV